MSVSGINLIVWRGLACYDLAVNLNIKVSKTLNHWLLLLASFRFCETQCLHFTTFVFGHSAITPFLGGSIHQSIFVKVPRAEDEDSKWS